jgi:hypothetical protein
VPAIFTLPSGSLQQKWREHRVIFTTQKIIFILFAYFLVAIGYAAIYRESLRERPP